LAEAPATPSEPGILRTLGVAFAVCAVCSAVVTTSVVLLRPLQEANRQRDRQARLEALVAGLPGVSELMAEAGGARLEVRVVELASGEYAEGIDPEALLRDPAGGAGEPLPPGRDPAGIGTRPRLAVVYLLRRGGSVHTAILPVYGQGYLSTMRGYLAVAGDGNTVRGITFTEHEETPGLGAEIANPDWQALWGGKRLRGPEGEVRIRVVQEVPPAADPHAVQGIAGATRTGDGVTALVRFWVGSDGFGPYLERLREDQG
jgi:Na+-transporting NADH:ubiquinone oxidoreductase subunit C